MATEKVVVLASGGINSTVVAAVAKEQYTVALMHVNWGHRAAESELQAFGNVAAGLKIETTNVVDLPNLANIGNCSRGTRRLPVEDAATLDHETPSTFMVGLIPTMLSLAAVWADTIGAKKIIIGTSENYGVPGPRIGALYPDYRREFLQVFNLMLDYSLPAKREIMVEAPLIDLNRAEIVQLGHRLRVPFNKTWSCYREGQLPCGRCWACASRAAGFLRAQIPDPLMPATSEAAV